MVSLSNGVKFLTADGVFVLVAGERTLIYG